MSVIGSSGPSARGCLEQVTVRGLSFFVPSPLAQYAREVVPGRKSIQVLWAKLTLGCIEHVAAGNLGLTIAAPIRNHAGEFLTGAERPRLIRPQHAGLNACDVTEFCLRVCVTPATPPPSASCAHCSVGSKSRRTLASSTATRTEKKHDDTLPRTRRTPVRHRDEK